MNITLNCTQKRVTGFTLIEILITLAIFFMITAVALTVTTDDYIHYSLSDERSRFISTVYRARSEAMNGLCLGTNCTTGVAHGVHIETNHYTLFQGSLYNPNDNENEDTMLHGSIKTRGATDIVFEEFSGDAHTLPVNISNIVFYTNTGMISTTTIERDGQVSWTK